MLSAISSATSALSSPPQPATEGGLLNIPTALDALMPSPPASEGGGLMLAELADFVLPDLDSLPLPGGGLTNVVNDPPGPEGRDRVREQLKNVMEALRG
jgi:hypothetical protein